jgi:tetratricopeptide (TPR) repeat protein
MPDPSIEHYNAAVDAIQAGRLPEALAETEISLTENPKDAETWQLYVIVLNALGRTEDAKKATGKLKELGLGEADGFLLQAAQAASSGDLATAISHYESALETGRDRPEIHCGYALALMENSQPSEALAAAEKAVALAPDDARTNYALGHILRLTGKKEAALAALTKAVSAESDFMIALYEQGMLFAESGQLDKALANFTRFLETHPGDPSATEAVETVRAKMGA